LLNDHADELEDEVVGFPRRRGREAREAMEDLRGSRMACESDEDLDETALRLLRVRLRPGDFMEGERLGQDAEGPFETR